MLNSQLNYYFTSNSNSDDNDNDGIPDCYESTDSENPENEYVLSNGKTTFSLINEPHSDKQTSRDTIYDVVTIEENDRIYYTDGIVDGEEIVFSIGGDANCDGIINSDDTLLLQNHLSGNAELTDNGTVNSDCDLDGEITFSDIAQINYYIDNGSNNAPNNLDMGDLNNDGAVNSIDLALMMNALLGVSSLNPAYVSRADFTGDGKIDVNDYILMKNYLINNSTSIVGLNYFYYNSDPMKNDTDGDKDWDQADPEPTVHQLNGYFARKLVDLQYEAKKYLSNSYVPDINDKFHGKKDICLCFCLIRKFKYDNFAWNNTTLDEPNFIEYVKNNNIDLYRYFECLEYIYSDGLNGESDLHTSELSHFAATLSTQLCTMGFAAEIYDSDDLKDYSGWAGDLQQAVTSAYEATYKFNEYSNIYDALYAYLRIDNKGFGPYEIYADVDSLNISKIILSKGMHPELESIFNDYYSLSVINNHEVDFINNVPLSISKIRYFLKTEKAYLEGGARNMNDSDIENCISAFDDYLYDELGVRAINE